MTPTGHAVERSVRNHVENLLETLRGVPPDVLNTWKPRAAAEGRHEMNTFAALAVHTVSAAEFHSLHMVGRAPSDRVRDAEFEATTSIDDIEARFNAFLGELHTLLDGMSEADLGAKPSPEAGQPDWTNADWLLHTVDHIALHTGHLQIHRQLWEYESQEG